MLRTAGALQAAKISATKIVVALANIRAALPPGSLLTTLALRTAEPNAVVREASNVWDSTSERAERPVATSKMANLPSHRPQPSRTLLIAEEHYARGYALEDSDIAAARAAYLDALNAHSDHIEARINLGRLLHLNGELKQAEEVYRQAKTSSALLSFNLAILLEDLNREEEAVLAYREALAQDPHLHDAHFNLSRLHERATRPQEALRHLLAYRRHVRSTNE